MIDKPYICKALTQVNPKDVKVRPIAADSAVKTAKVYTFDITKADAIFDQLLLAKMIKLRPGHNIPMAEELKGRIYCKYHDSSKHTTNNCVVFRDTIQKWIDDGKLKFPEKKMTVDTDPFPTTTVGMIGAHLPQDKGKEKIETVSARYIPRKGIKPRLQVDLSSNPPPGDSTRPAIFERVSSSKGEIIPARRYLTKGCQASDSRSICPRIRLLAIQSSRPLLNQGQALMLPSPMNRQLCVHSAKPMVQLNPWHSHDREQGHVYAQNQQHLKRRRVRIRAIPSLTGSAHKRSNHPRSGDDSTLILHSTMKSITPQLW